MNTISSLFHACGLLCLGAFLSAACAGSSAPPDGPPPAPTTGDLPPDAPPPSAAAPPTTAPQAATASTSDPALTTGASPWTGGTAAASASAPPSAAPPSAAPAPSASASSAPSGPAGANLRVGSMSVDGMTFEDLACRADGLGLLGSMIVAGGIAKKKAALVACAPKGDSARVEWTAAKGKVAVSAVKASTPAIEACVKKALTGTAAPFEGECAATLVIGK